MEVDIRKHGPVREDVRVGIAALRVQGRQIIGTYDGDPDRAERVLKKEYCADSDAELKSRMGARILRTILDIDDLGFDPLECLDLAFFAHEVRHP